MAVVDADIIVYGSNSMPDDDTATQIGGAINKAIRVVFTDIDPTGGVEMVSDGADTRNVTLYYLDSASVLKSETKALDGTNVVAFTDNMGAILKAVVASASATRTVTVRKASAGATLITFVADDTHLQTRRVCYNAVANPAGGATKKYYDKVFIANENATTDLQSAQVIEQADPNAVMAFILEATLDGTGDNGVGNNRQVAPTGTFDSSTKNVANSGVLTHEKAQGAWVELTLADGVAPADTSFTLRLSGISG